MNHRLTISILFCGIAYVLTWPTTAEAACTISTTSVNFGSYNVFNVTPTDSTGTVTYECGKKDSNIRVRLNKGGAATFAGRRMVKGAENLFYNLFMDAARTIIWGDGTEGTQDYVDANPPNSTPVVLTIFGRVTAAQDVTAGVYTNTVVASVIF